MIDIKNVSIESIRPADWRATHMLKPDLKLLSQSMIENGWLYPVVVRKDDSTIIDGFHRWLVAKNDPEFRKKHGSTTIPIVSVKVDLIDAMVMHVRLNRTRGILLAEYVSYIVNDALKSRKYSEMEMRRLLAMTADELSVLRDGSLLKHRNIAEHEYSKAWVPVEVPAGEETPTVDFEKPPNGDR